MLASLTGGTMPARGGAGADAGVGWCRAHPVVTSVVNTFLNRDGARVIARMVRGALHSASEVALCIGSDCANLCSALIEAASLDNGGASVVKKARVGAAQACDAGGILHALGQHVVKRCIRRPTGSGPAPALELAEQAVCGAAITLVGRMLDNGCATAALREPSMEFLSHVARQLEAGDLSRDEDMLRNRVNTLSARLSMIVVDK
eukprot:g1831.t1